jgi:hypothetical protein
MKKYEKIEGTDKQLKIEIYYDKGGMNYFNGKNEPRGYWLSMRQVERKVEDHGVVIESYGMFSGAKAFLKEVKKKSDKAYQEAIALAESKMNDLKLHVLAKND